MVLEVARLYGHRPDTHDLQTDALAIVAGDATKEVLPPRPDRALDSAHGVLGRDRLRAGGAHRSLSDVGAVLGWAHDMKTWV